ncbi:hypothetical protein [Halobaculum sp. D14]|uniref:hypothetical protein n=1 Tax=Halobaculum sp. D14 TaxID=3421642 RepID=UPI003EBA4CB5
MVSRRSVVRTVFGAAGFAAAAGRTAAATTDESNADAAAADTDGEPWAPTDDPTPATDTYATFRDSDYEVRVDWSAYRFASVSLASVSRFDGFVEPTLRVETDYVEISGADVRVAGRDADGDVVDETVDGDVDVDERSTEFVSALLTDPDDQVRTIRVTLH